MLKKLLKALREVKMLSASRARNAWAKKERKIRFIERTCMDIATAYDECPTAANKKMVEDAEDAIDYVQSQMKRKYDLNSAYDILGMLFNEDA